MFKFIKLNLVKSNLFEFNYVPMNLAYQGKRDIPYKLVLQTRLNHLAAQLTES